MRKSILFLSVLFTAALGFAQNVQKVIPVCHTSATEKFALFASNKSFNKEHLNPLPYVHVSMAGGEMIKLKSPDGKDANAFFIPAKTKTNNWLFVFQEWWGLNEYVKKQAEVLYGDLGNVNVLALDMYDGTVASERETAQKLMQEFKQERGDVIVKSALAYAGKDAKISTIGWCFGGGQSMQAALTSGKQAVACVIFYGMPETNVDRLKTLNCDVLDIYGLKDTYINTDLTTKFETAMKEAGKKITVKSYDAPHAFANPSNPAFDKIAAADAHKLTLEFLKARIK